MREGGEGFFLGTWGTGLFCGGEGLSGLEPPLGPYLAALFLKGPPFSSCIGNVCRIAETGSEYGAVKTMIRSPGCYLRSAHSQTLNALDTARVPLKTWNSLVK